MISEFGVGNRVCIWKKVQVWRDPGSARLGESLVPPPLYRPMQSEGRVGQPAERKDLMNYIGDSTLSETGSKRSFTEFDTAMLKKRRVPRVPRCGYGM